MRSNKVIKKPSLDTIGNKRLLGINSIKKGYEKKRAAKALTKASMYKMFALDSPINDDYRQAYMCNEYLFQNGKKITSNYCQKKCCTVCNRIKSAQNLVKYGERILSLENLYLVTLTNKNVFPGHLEDEVDRMYQSLIRIKKNLYKTYKIRINGFRSFECTYSFEKGFNPHFHFIVQGKDVASTLIKLWLDQFKGTASASAQDMKPVRNDKKSLLEVFKYIAKPVTKGYYSATAYDETMITAKKHRVTEALGSIRGRSSDRVDDLDIGDLHSQEIDFKGDRIEVWKYITDLYDYVSPEGELLLGTPLQTKTKKALYAIQKDEIRPKSNQFKGVSPESMLYQNRPRDGEDYLF